MRRRFAVPDDDAFELGRRLPTGPEPGNSQREADRFFSHGCFVWPLGREGNDRVQTGRHPEDVEPEVEVRYGGQ